MEEWRERSKPSRLEKRFVFDNYDQTRDFLEKLGELSEKRNIFPDISFGKTYANLTLQVNDDNSIENDTNKSFASEIDKLVKP